MSNRLTFSLASLVLIMGLVFATAPAMAQVVDIGDGASALTSNSFRVISKFATPRGVDAPQSETDIPDLAEQFSRGVTISLIAPTGIVRAGTDVAADATTDIKARDIVISEIMWGIDNGSVFAERENQQWIEIYNTTGVDITMDGTNNWIIHFMIGRSGPFFNKALGYKTDFNHDADDGTTDEVEYMLIDQVSNLGTGGWVNDVGQSGVLARTTPIDGVVLKDIISMYRKINYDRVEKGDHDTDAAENRKAQLKDFPNGNAKGGWAASTNYYDTNLVGTPGEKHFVGISIVGKTTVPFSPVIINEVGNYDGEKYDWIELRNVTDAAVNIKKWVLSRIEGKDGEMEMAKFPDDNYYTLPANGILLVVGTDPYNDEDHPLAAGTKWNKNEAHEDTTATDSLYYVSADLKLPSDGDVLLVLRNRNDRKNSHEGIVDLVGAKKIVDQEGRSTDYWPLRGSGGPHGDVFKDALAEKYAKDLVYKRAKANQSAAEHTWEKAGFTGIGYKRNFDDMADKHGGTPGFANDALKAKATDLTDAKISISEIMYDRGSRDNLPQWIELYNDSTMQGINLENWKLKLENADDVDGRTNVTVTLPKTFLPPNQTVLIVSRTTGRTSNEAQGGNDFPDTRVIDLWDKKDTLEVDDRNYRLLSATAFRLTLMQKDAKATDDPIDVVGNMGDDGEAMWELPMMDEDAEGRSSIIRRYDAGEARDGTMPIWSGKGSLGDAGGEGNAGWVLASESNLNYIQSDTYYGSNDDIGTPGFRGGGPLPVSLSKFRPERLATGEIVVRWITESELENAGFNILRSETRNGQFTKLNAQLIEGHGTTSEKNAYEFVDKTAKPNVVYYYQIQDVSFDGDITTLRTTHLRGNVSAAGKLTTTWGELKALQ